MKKYLFIFLAFLLTACGTNMQRGSLSDREYAERYSDSDDFYESLMTELAYTEDQKNLIAFGKGLLGSPYIYGEEDPGTGFDCSGFTQYVYANSLDKRLPRTSREMRLVGTPVYNKNDLEAGDLVFFNLQGRNSSHVGIYIGNGRFFHASPSIGSIVIGNMKHDYFSKRFSGARRVLNFAEHQG